MADWMLTKSFAPLLQIRLDGTTLKLLPNPHQKSIVSTYRSIQRLGRPKQARGYLSPKIGARWHLFRVDSTAFVVSGGTFCIVRNTAAYLRRADVDDIHIHSLKHTHVHALTGPAHDGSVIGFQCKWNQFVHQDLKCNSYELVQLTT